MIRTVNENPLTLLTNLSWQECEEDLTQKGELVSRLQKKTSQIGKILNNMEKYNHLLREPGRPAQSTESNASRPTSWGSLNYPKDNIFDKKSPNYYKKVDPLNNIDFSKLKKSPKTPEDVDTGGPPPTKVDKKDENCENKAQE